MIGSFNPIHEGDWKSDACIHPMAEEICSAVSRGDLNQLKSILDGPDSANVKDPMGRSALHLAVLCNQLEIFDHLVELGADSTAVMVDGRNVLHLASAYGHVEIVKSILRIIELDEIKQKSDPVYARSIASKKERLKYRKTVLTNQEGRNLIANRNESPLLTVDMIDWDNRMSPLHYAVIFGHVEIVNMLLKAGADVNQTVYYSPAEESHLHVSYTCLYLASLGYNEASISIGETLLEHGVSVLDIDHHHRTVLHCAVLDRNVTFVEMLFETDPKTTEALNLLGFSPYFQRPVLPLCDAVVNQDIAMMKVLLKHGANMEADESSINSFLMRIKRSPVQPLLQRFQPTLAQLSLIPKPFQIATGQRWLEGIEEFISANQNHQFLTSLFTDISLCTLQIWLGDLKSQLYSTDRQIFMKSLTVGNGSTGDSEIETVGWLQSQAVQVEQLKESIQRLSQVLSYVFKFAETVETGRVVSWKAQSRLLCGWILVGLVTVISRFLYLYLYSTMDVTEPFNMQIKNSTVVGGGGHWFYSWFLYPSVAAVDLFNLVAFTVPRIVYDLSFVRKREETVTVWIWQWNRFSAELLLLFTLDFRVFQRLSLYFLDRRITGVFLPLMVQTFILLPTVRFLVKKQTNAESKTSFLLWRVVTYTLLCWFIGRFLLAFYVAFQYQPITLSTVAVTSMDNMMEIGFGCFIIYLAYWQQRFESLQRVSTVFLYTLPNMSFKMFYLFKRKIRDILKRILEFKKYYISSSLFDINKISRWFDIVIFPSNFRFISTEYIHEYAKLQMNFWYRRRVDLLFKSALNGDVQLLNRLTSTMRESVSEPPVFVTVKNDAFKTPLHIALTSGHNGYVKRLLEIVEEQYTPVPVVDQVVYEPDSDSDPEEEEEDQEERINNLDLLALAEDTNLLQTSRNIEEIDTSPIRSRRPLKMKQNINPDRKRIKQPSTATNIPSSSSSCVVSKSRCPPWTFLLDVTAVGPGDIRGLTEQIRVNALGLAVLTGNSEAVNMLIEFATRLDIQISEQFKLRINLNRNISEASAWLEQAKTTVKKRKYNRLLTRLKRELPRYTDLDTLRVTGSLVDHLVDSRQVGLKNNPIALAVIFNRKDILKLLIERTGAGFNVDQMPLKPNHQIDADAIGMSRYRPLQFETDEDMQQNERRIHSTGRRNGYRPYERRVDIYSHPLLLAAYYGRIDILQFLLSGEPERMMNQFIRSRVESGIDLSKRDTSVGSTMNQLNTDHFRSVSEYTGQEMWHYFVKISATTDDDCNVFGWAVRGKQKETIKYLAQHKGPGSDALQKALNWTVRSPLHIACEEGYMECIEPLLAAGAEPFTVSKTTHLLPIHEAVLRNDMSILTEFSRLLPTEAFKRMLGVKTEKAKESLLMFAVHFEHTAIVRFLLEQNAELISALDHAGNSALMYVLNPSSTVPDAEQQDYIYNNYNSYRNYYQYNDPQMPISTPHINRANESILEQLLDSPQSQEQSLKMAELIVLENHVGANPLDAAMNQFTNRLRRVSQHPTAVKANTISAKQLESIRLKSQQSGSPLPRSVCTFDDMNIVSTVSVPTGSDDLTDGNKIQEEEEEDALYSSLFPHGEPIHHGIDRFKRPLMPRVQLLQVNLESE